MKGYGAILWAPWHASGMDKQTITGQWAEDGSTYTITVPHQLRGLVIAMQNELCEKYRELDDLRRQLERKELEAQRILPDIIGKEIDDA